LGYSSFKIPASFCRFCLDGIRSYWYGLEKKTGNVFLDHDLIG
jgi:hypothetical protein